MQAISFAVTPVSSAMIHPAHAMGAFGINERVDVDARLFNPALHVEAAARLGVVMAETSQRGFEVFTVHGGGPPGNPYRPDDIRAEVLARLCLVADTDRSSFLWRVGKPCWMGRIDGGIRRCMVGEWVRGRRMGRRREWACGWKWPEPWWRWGWRTMRVVVVVSMEHCVSVGCVDGGRAWSCVCVPVLSHGRVCLRVSGRVLRKIAD